jgi:hypothetical protein
MTTSIMKIGTILKMFIIKLNQPKQQQCKARAVKATVYLFPIQ